MNAATFLVQDGLCALLNTFLLKCDSTTTTQVWARWKHFVSLLQFKTKLNASMTARNKRNKTLITFRQNILQMWECYWCVSTTNSKYCKKKHFNLGIAFCLVSWSNNTLKRCVLKFFCLFSIWWEFIIAGLGLSTVPNYSVRLQVLKSNKCKPTVTYIFLYFRFLVK